MHSPRKSKHIAGKSSQRLPVICVVAYACHTSFDRRTTPHIRHDLPNAFFDLLESLININPFERPSASYVKEVVQQLRGQSSPRPRPRKPPHSPKYDEVSSKTLIPRQSSPSRFPKKLPSPEAPAVVRSSCLSDCSTPLTCSVLLHQALPPTSRQWALTVFETGRGRSRELQMIGLLAARAFLGLFLASVSERSTIGRTGSLPISTLVLLISISAVEVVNNVSLAAACLTTSVLACLAYLVPQSVFLG